MIIVKTAVDLQKIIDYQLKKEQFIGFVPTMGALHSGHISLLKAARERSNFVVCSIFVNPTQFNDPADFANYPITIDRDIELLEEAGCDLLFLPDREEIYPTGTETRHYDLGYLETLLEGAFRPGHFQGVCMVVERLLRIVQPQQLYIGQKDYQQCMVITRLVNLMHWQDQLEIHICPTLREANGLAMSSRNMRLSADERAMAPTIFETLQWIKAGLQPGDLMPLLSQANEKLVAAGFRPDYVAIANAKDLSPVQHWDGRTPLVALVAAFLNKVRLIDNLVLTE